MNDRFEIPEDVKVILNRLNDHYEAYIVGGCVRDLILGIEPHDYDICTSATPGEIMNIFHDERIIETGLKHGTVTILYNGVGYEITTYRIDGSYSDGRHPDDVIFTTDIIKDLGRRDFTINAMAYNKDIGLVDPFGGFSDLRHKKIRCVGFADDRFSEDALRILRAMRFAIRYGFDIEMNTYEAMIRSRQGLETISKERITSELEKMLSCGKAVRSIFLSCKDVMAVILPELECCMNFNQHNKYHMHDVYEHILSVVDYCETGDFVIKLAALLHDIGKPSTYTEDESGYGHFYEHQEASYEISKEVISKRLRLSNEQYDETLLLIRYHDMDVVTTKKSVKRALNKLGEGTFRKWLILKLADRKDHIGFNADEMLTDLKHIEDMLNDIIINRDCFSIKDLAVNGNDLINIGYKQGKELGAALNQLLQQVLDGCENDKEKLLEIAGAIMSE